MLESFKKLRLLSHRTKKIKTLPMYYYVPSILLCVYTCSLIYSSKQPYEADTMVMIMLIVQGGMELRIG